MQKGLSALRCIKTVNFMPKLRLVMHLTIARPPDRAWEGLAASPPGRLASLAYDASSRTTC
jgi:hypothetical protein